MPRLAATLPAAVMLAVAPATVFADGAAPPADTAADAAAAEGVVRLSAPAAAGADAEGETVIRAQNRAGRGRTIVRPTEKIVRPAARRQAAPAPAPAAVSSAAPGAPVPVGYETAAGPAVTPVAGTCETGVCDTNACGTCNGAGCPGGACLTGGRFGRGGLGGGMLGGGMLGGGMLGGGMLGGGMLGGGMLGGGMLGGGMLGGRGGAIVGPHGAYADCPQCRGECPQNGCPVCLGLPGLPIFGRGIPVPGLIGLPGAGCLPGAGLFAPGGYFNRGGVWTPRHVHNYGYDAPRGLLYPEGARNPNRPGQTGPLPVVQYPYYTTKGPDDFFHDRDGEF